MSTAPTRVRRLPVLLAAATAAISLLAACSGGSSGTPTPVPDVTKAAVIEPAKVAPPAPVVPPRWPLTGVAAAEVPVRPALAVKIENSADARPQTGLDQADNVWEEVVEGGISRFVAVYHSQVPAEVGPIRSVRPMDPAIVGPMHGLIAFSGGQPIFVNALKAAGVQTISQDAGAAGFYRKKGVGPAPHNVYGTPQTFWDQADADHSAAPPAQFVIAKRADAATAVVAGTPAGTVAVKLSGYAKPTWTWDAGSGAYLRSEGSDARGRAFRRADRRHQPRHPDRAPGGLRHGRPRRQPGPRDGAGRHRRGHDLQRRQVGTGDLVQGWDERDPHPDHRRRDHGDARARHHLDRARALGQRFGHDELTRPVLPGCSACAWQPDARARRQGGPG